MKGCDNMPQIIYTDNVGTVNGVPLNNTYAAKYAVTSLDNILDEISRGNIQCGTGQIQPVNWADDKQQPPWDAGGPQSSNPWKKY
jgi:hypothetical protein